MYTFTSEYEDETEGQYVEHSLHNECDLTALLTALTYFLRAAGFDYVEGLTAVKNDGSEAYSSTTF